MVVLSLGSRSVRAPPQYSLSDAEILERLDARDIGAASVSQEDKWHERNDPIAVLRQAWVAEGFSEEVCVGTFPLREEGGVTAPVIEPLPDRRDYGSYPEALKGDYWDVAREVRRAEIGEL